MNRLIGIKSVGLRHYLNNSRDRHNGFGYEDFVKFNNGFGYNRKELVVSEYLQARLFGVSRPTIHYWKDYLPEPMIPDILSVEIADKIVAQNIKKAKQNEGLSHTRSIDTSSIS